MGKGDKDEGEGDKVIKGYLKNPFGSDFIRLEVDSDRLKHNKTSGVVHVPLVVVDKSLAVTPRRRNKKKRKNRPLLPPLKLGGPLNKIRPKRKLVAHPKMHPKLMQRQQQLKQQQLQRQKQLQERQKVRHVQSQQQSQGKKPARKPTPLELRQQQLQQQQQHAQMQKQRPLQEQQKVKRPQQRKKPMPKHMRKFNFPPKHPKNFDPKVGMVRRKQRPPRLQQQLQHQHQQLQQLLHSAADPKRMRDVVDRIPDAIQSLPGFMHKLIAGMKAETPFVGRELKEEK